MVNLIAQKKVVPELMQDEMTGERLAAETARLLNDAGERGKMKDELARVAALLPGTVTTPSVAQRMQSNGCLEI